MRGRWPAVLQLALAAALAAACGPSDEEGLYRARKAELERRNRGLAELISEARQGSLLPPDRFMVGVDESLTRDLFESQLPLEQVVRGLVVVHLDRATFRFREKYGTVRIDGGIRFRGLPVPPVALGIQGGLDEVELDPETGVLRVRIAIDHVAVEQAAGLEGLLGRGALNFLGGGARDLLAEAIPPLDVPVSIEQAIPVPALEEGGVSLPAVEVPLAVSVERVLAAGGKLWVIFAAEVGRVLGAEDGLGVEIDAGPKGDPS